MKVGPIALLQLAGHKARQRGQWFFDEHGGLARRAHRERERAVQLLAPFSSLAAWLARPGGGRLWLSPDGASAWARSTCTEVELTWAREVVAGRFNLLGVDAAELGNPPSWNRDLYTRKDWPLAPASRLPLARNDGGDIRTLWELSRCYYFVALAQAYWKTGEPVFLETFRKQVESWIEQNPPGLGANWLSPMDAAIRACNWALAAVLFGSAEGLPEEFWAALLGNLRLTAHFVATHLEWHPVYRGNHYVADAVGLVYIGALFADDAAGAGWLRLGARILREEMDYQVARDGATLEAALGYHRLLAELFSYGGEVCELSLPGVLPASYWQSLERMFAFITTHLDVAGQAALLGDADDGRLHTLCHRSITHPREHRLGLPERFWPQAPPSSGQFSEGGFYVLRSETARCVVRCGAVGLHGAGSHDHNDQLSYELSIGGLALISDSGTYAYTRDLRERFAFRSTASHNAIQLGDEEQNPIVIERPWRVLADRTRSRCVEWRVDADGVRFLGEHSGFSHRESGAVTRRAIELRHQPEQWRVVDRVEGKGSEAIVWRTHFAPGELSVTAKEPGRWQLHHTGLAACRIELVASAPLELRVEQSRRSERYGQWLPRPVVVLRGAILLPLEITLSLEMHS